MYTSRSNVTRYTAVLGLALMSGAAGADTILVDQPKGVVIKLLKTGAPACGVVSWDSIRRSGIVSIAGKTVEIKEPKLPLSKDDWSALLATVAGGQEEVTIAHAWPDAAGGVAAALRVAYDIRSHGGKAWALNGPVGSYAPPAECVGAFKFTAEPQQVYMSDADFWSRLNNSGFIDARGKEAAQPAPYTWVVGAPKGAKIVDFSSYVVDGKVDTKAISCKDFDNVGIVGCDSLHKTLLVVEAARFANCKSQPQAMPYWGLTGISRQPELAKKVWGDDLVMNSKRSGDWAAP